MNPDYSSHSLRGLIGQFRNGVVVCSIPQHGWIETLTSIADYLEKIEQTTHEKRHAWVKTTGLPKRLQRILMRSGCCNVDQITEENLEGVYQCGAKSIRDLIAFRQQWYANEETRVDKVAVIR